MSSTGQHTDVIFVVEGTALCGAYLHELRSQYIIPTLEYFSGPIDEKDCGSDSNYCLYGLVVFHAADILPDFLVNTVGPLNTSYKLLNQIDRIRFTGGHGEAMSNVGEGLATALECLEDLVEFRSTLTDVIDHVSERVPVERRQNLETSIQMNVKRRHTPISVVQAGRNWLSPLAERYVSPLPLAGPNKNKIF